MKKISALIIIGLLCFSMFSVLLPKVKAESVTLETLWTTPVTDNTSFVSDIGDVNGNGNPEVAVLDAHWPTGPATVQVLKNDGTTLWITSINFAGTGIAVEDTNLDGNAEVYVFGTTGVPPHYGDPIIACFDANGNQLWQFTRHETSPWSRDIDWVSFVNLDLDPQLEIFCGGGGWADYINYAFDTNGALMWTFTTRDIGSDWKIGDVNGDGADEIVLFTFQEVYILSKSGTLLRTIQPHTTSAWAQGALGDVNGDGVAEIVDSIKSYDISYNFVNTLFVYKGDGTLLWQKNYPQNPDGTPMNPILVDLTGDGIQDVVVLANKLINAYKNDGTLLWTFSDINPTRPWEVFITNFDLIKGDNKDEILFQCDQGLYILSLNGELIQRFDVPNQGRWVQSGHIGKDPRVDNLYYEFGDINNDGTNELIMDEVIDGQHYVAVGSLERPLGGLVGYWKFDEGSGSVAYDSSGYGNDGTIYGATWVDGIKGKALHFDGVDDWVRILSTSSISGLSQITLEAWIKEDSVATTVKGIISKCTGIAHPTYDAEYYLGLYGQDLAFHVSNYNYIAHDTVSGAINEADRWYHVAATWSGDSYTIYVDGVPRKSGTCTPQTTFSNTVDLQIGRHGSWSWVYFHGVIDEVMIYNYARTAEEIWNDFTQVSMTWEKYAGNPVLDIGPSGSWDDLSVWAPTVLFKDGMYKMWYCGGRNDQYIRIGLATSLDGISWIRYGTTPVLDVSPSGWDSFQVSCPSVLFDGSKYCMWYSGDNGYSIGLATSDDGISWTKYSGNPVLTGGRYPSVIFDGSIYKMWYEGYDYTINYATSTDGIVWTEYSGNPVLVPGPSGSWDGMYVSTPSVIFDGSQYIMSYTGYKDSMLSRRIGIAYSPDGIVWSKDPDNPIIDVGPVGAWDDTFVDHSALLLVGSSLKMWYSGFDGTNTLTSPTYYHRIGLATLGVEPDFEILPIEPEYAVADPHKTTEFKITVKSLNGFNQPVALSAVYSSHELSGTFEEAVVTPPAGGSVTTTLRVSVLSEAINTHQIYITGKSGALSHTKTATLHVPYMSVPYLSQGDVNWCLPTSVAMVCRFYGKQVHQADVASGLRMSHSGLSLPIPPDYKDRVRRYVVDDLGLKFELGAEWNRLNLANMLNKGLPAVLSVRDEYGLLPAFFHSVVITGFNVEKDLLFISDPSGVLVDGIYTINPERPYVHVAVPFADLEDYLTRNSRVVDSWFGIDGNPNPKIGLLNIIGGDLNEYRTVSISQNSYRPWRDSYRIYWYGVPFGLTWTGFLARARHFPCLSENDYLAVYGFNEFPIINPTDTTRDYKFEVAFVQSGVVKGTSGKLPISNVGACDMKNTPISRDSPLRLGDVISETGFYNISLRLYDSEDRILDWVDLPQVWYSTKPTFGIQVYSPANVFVIDPLRRSIGFNPTINESVNEIPGAFYSGPGTEPQIIMIPDPINGSYNILLVGTASGDYTLTVEYITAEQTTTQTFNGTISENEHQYYSAVISETGEMNAISWEHVFKDPKRGTILKVSADDKFFQFVAPDKDFGIKCDADMKVLNHVILICYEDSEMRLVATAVNDKIDFCSAIAWDKQTRKCYLLIDKPNLPRYIRCHFFI